MTLTVNIIGIYWLQYEVQGTFYGYVVRILYSCSTLMSMDNGWHRWSSGMGGTRISLLRNNGFDPLRKCDMGASDIYDFQKTCNDLYIWFMMNHTKNNLNNWRTISDTESFSKSLTGLTMLTGLNTTKKAKSFTEDTNSQLWLQRYPEKRKWLTYHQPSLSRTFFGFGKCNSHLRLTF